MTPGPPRAPGGEPGGAALGQTAWVALLIWLGVCGVVFLPYELVERWWLGEVSPETRDLAHLLRGVVASLLATLATSAYLLRRAVPRLERSLGEPSEAHAAGVMAVGRGLASWMLGLRWVAAFAAAAVVLFASLVSGRLAPESTPRVYAGVLVLLGFNAMLDVLGPRRLASQRALALQVAGDVIILGWLTHFAGGMRNPFAGFFVFHAVIAAVILEPRPARGVALGIAAFVLSLTGLELAGGPFAPGCLLEAGRTCAGHGDRLLHAAAGGAVATMVVVCGLIVSALVRVLRAERDRLAQATARLAAHAESLAAAQVQVQRERANLQSLIDCMADAVIYVAPDGAVRLHNQAAARFWPTGTADSDLRACHAPESWRQLMERVANPAPIEVHPVFAVDGRTYEGSYARVDDVDGSLRGVVMVARDVTERIEAQNWRMQEERMSVVGKLAAGIAHEINNPLGAIALFAQHALAGLEPGHPLAEHLGTVLRNADLCKKIVRDLLEYARQRPPERRVFALTELLGDVVRTVEPQAQASRVAVRTENANGAGTMIYGDPDQLRQVFVNLGLNAVEAMPGGGQLTFRIAPAGPGWTRIDVADTGTGIAPEEQERIFAAFHTTKAEGTGLGLTVARDLVTAHHGTIAVESAPGRGTTFSVRLPASPAASGSEVAS